MFKDNNGCYVQNHWWLVAIVEERQSLKPSAQHPVYIDIAILLIQSFI